MKKQRGWIDFIGYSWVKCWRASVAPLPPDGVHLESVCAETYEFRIFCGARASESAVLHARRPESYLRRVRGSDVVSIFGRRRPAPTSAAPRRVPCCSRRGARLGLDAVCEAPSGIERELLNPALGVGPGTRRRAQDCFRRPAWGPFACAVARGRGFLGVDLPGRPLDGERAAGFRARGAKRALRGSGGRQDICGFGGSPFDSLSRTLLFSSPLAAP